MCVFLCNIELLAPFGPEVGDNVLSRGEYETSDVMYLSPAFPYFGQNMTSLFVNLNGFLTFLSPCDPSQCLYARPLPFTSPPLIAALWSNYILASNDTGAVYYRIVRDTSFLRTVSDFIYEERYERINASFAVVVTWYELPDRMSSDLNSRNTFQAILATDGYTSYVAFSYRTLGISIGGYAGFNFGDGISHLSLDNYGIEERSNLISMTAGRYLYRVNGMFISYFALVYSISGVVVVVGFQRRRFCCLLPLT